MTDQDRDRDRDPDFERLLKLIPKDRLEDVIFVGPDDLDEHRTNEMVSLAAEEAHRADLGTEDDR